MNSAVPAIAVNTGDRGAELKLRVLFFALVVVFCLSVQAAAEDQVMKVTPQGDSMWWRYTGWGGAHVPNASPNEARYFYMGPPAYVEMAITYMQFDLLTMPSDFTSAILSLNVLSAGTEYDPALGTALLKHRTDSTGATGEGAEGYGGDALVQKMGTATGWVNIDVTSYILADKAAGYRWACFSMDYVANGYGSAGVSFSSGDDVANAPRLTVTPVPEPSSLLALGSGATGLGGFAIRKRK